MLTTRRRFASTNRCCASISPSTTRHARACSCSPVKRGKRPISARYCRMALSTPRSSSASSSSHSSSTSSMSSSSSSSNTSSSNTSSSRRNIGRVSRWSSTPCKALFANATMLNHSFTSNPLNTNISGIDNQPENISSFLPPAPYSCKIRANPHINRFFKCIYA